MTEQLSILCCEDFASEVRAAVEVEGWADVCVASFPARCGRPPVGWEELRCLLPVPCSEVLLIGRVCLHGLGEAPRDFPPVRTVEFRQCFHLVAGEKLVDEAICGGGYLVTPGWLADWRGKLATLGFTVDTAGEYFREFAREIVLLDTGIGGEETAVQLAEFAAATGLTARGVPVGLDTVRLHLVHWVLEWRLAQSQTKAKVRSQEHASELSDHVAAMDMLAHLAKCQDEGEAIASIVDLSHMLFAPAALHYVRVKNGVLLPAQPLSASLHEQLTTLNTLPGDHAWTSDEQGFLLRIAHGEETLGLLAVEQLAFPQYRQRYLNMALALTGVLGLAIENTRNRKRLLEAEKMASLGIMVAGVAHEVNTPLGICLAASSTLQAQTQEIRERFASRSMTQKDLTSFLEKASTSTGLLLPNLERIARLVDTFRQVAVEGQALERHPLSLRECIDEVLLGLGSRLVESRVSVIIECASDVVFRSCAADWANILRNLILNSLNHGFRGRDCGVIRIRATLRENRLLLDYRDDGAGMTAESRARIFDPFYTTNLQQGMGLGMHLVHNLIVHRMHGAISCDSAPEQGIHLHIEIPT